jgi:hypothetical protein
MFLFKLIGSMVTKCEPFDTFPFSLPSNDICNEFRFAVPKDQMSFNKYEHHSVCVWWPSRQVYSSDTWSFWIKQSHSLNRDTAENFPCRIAISTQVLILHRLTDIQQRLTQTQRPLLWYLSFAWFLFFLPLHFITVQMNQTDFRDCLSVVVISRPWRNWNSPILSLSLLTLALHHHR